MRTTQKEAERRVREDVAEGGEPGWSALLRVSSHPLSACCRTKYFKQLNSRKVTSIRQIKGTKKDLKLISVKSGQQSSQTNIRLLIIKTHVLIFTFNN